jgi:hypothetical protein
VSKRPTEPNDWSSASETLFRAARTDPGPRPADRERVRNALAQRLADASNAPVADFSSQLPAASKSSAALSTLVKVGFGVVLLMAGVFALMRAGDPPKRIDSKLSEQAGVAGARNPEHVPSTPVPPPGVEADDRVALASRESLGDSASTSASSGHGLAREKPSTRGGNARESTAAQKHASAHATPRRAAMDGPATRGAAADVEDSVKRDPAESATSSNGPTSARAARGTDQDSAQPSAEKKAASSSASRDAASSEDDAEDPAPAAKNDESHRALANANANAELDASDPRAELVFVQRIQAALLDAKPRKVLALCAEHEKRWPRGTFVEEREGLRAIASCQEDVREAAARASQYFRAYSRGPLAPRVRDACAQQLKAAVSEHSTAASRAPGSQGRPATQP